MTRASVLLLLAAFALFALSGRRAEVDGGALAAPLPGTPQAEQDAWRLRLIELALASGRTPARDRFLDAPQGRAVPWPPLFPAAMAALAGRLTFAERDPLQRGALGDGELEAFLRRWLPLLGALAVLAAFLASRALHGGERADLAGLCAAALWAFLPGVVLAERAGRVDPHAWAALLGLGVLAATAFALRAREEVDATLGGLLGGLATGLALASAVDVLVPVVAALAAFTVAAVRDRAGSRRALTLFVVVAAVVASLVAGRGTPWSAWLPMRVGWGPDGLASLRYWPAAVLAPAALVTLAAGWRHRARFTTALLLLLAMGWAALFDPGAAGVHVGIVVGAGVACADLAERLGPRRAALAVAGLALLAAPALLFREDAPRDLEAPQIRPSALAARQGLAWMRASSPSAGPWNSADARPDWWVLTAPSAGASFAAGARRPVLAAAPAGLRANAARAEQAALLLAGPADASQAEVLRLLGVRYVAVGAFMERDPWLTAARQEAGGESLFDVLLAGNGGIEGFERVWPPGAEPAPYSIWQVGAPASSPPPTLRSR